MFPSSLPALPILQLLVIATLAIVALVLTNNVLVLPLCLMAMWSPPPFMPREQQDEGQEDAVGGDQIGFVRE